LAVVEYLLEHDAEIDALDADDWTPVHHACSRGHLELLKLIQSKKADNFRALLRKATNVNATCIHLAVQSGNVDLVTYILSAFTDDVLPRLINEQEEPLGTPLHVAGKLIVYLLDSSDENDRFS
jgi:ankyrin repeat protein